MYTGRSSELGFRRTGYEKRKISVKIEKIQFYAMGLWATKTVFRVPF